MEGGVGEEAERVVERVAVKEGGRREERRKVWTSSVSKTVEKERDGEEVPAGTAGAEG